MIHFLHGALAGKSNELAFIEVQGVGFGVYMPQTHLAALGDVGSDVCVFTYMAVREDDISLYGFLDEHSKEVFKQLINVSGVGPKIGMAAFSTFDVHELQSIIASQDVTQLSKVPGIGKKGAQRIILELQGKLDFTGSPHDAYATHQDNREDVVLATEALLAMGFSPQEAELALKDAPSDTTTEASLIQYALKRLGS
ncbi:MAG: Holliday junction branch migration protein RuvA [Eggerthellaceae bacterium]|nr:Holliday junction branch migration protein RuvA [Eggerthellaceae bacterium]